MCRGDKNCIWQCVVNYRYGRLGLAACMYVWLDLATHYPESYCEYVKSVLLTYVGYMCYIYDTCQSSNKIYYVQVPKYLRVRCYP